MATFRGRDPRTLSCLVVEVDAGQISSVRALPAEECGDVWIAPGLVDLQVNGYRGLDLNGEDLTRDVVVKLTRTLANLGTTTFLPTLITASHQDLKSRLQIIANARECFAEVRHAVPCVHLEGPFLSPEPGFRGAHPGGEIREPSLREFDALQAACGGLIGMVTLSPHWQGTPAFVRSLVDRGVVVAIGHSHATHEQIVAAVDAGARLSTHLGNGAAAMLPRHPNPLWSQLADDRLTASFLADGAHLPPETLRVFLRAKTIARSILISDSVALTGAPPGVYHSRIGGDVVVQEDGSIRMTESGLLAGAGISLGDAVSRVPSLGGVSLGDAVRMATQIPASLLQLPAGSLHEGVAADLLLFRWNPGAISLDIVNVLVQGRPVLQPVENDA